MKAPKNKPMDNEDSLEWFREQVEYVSQENFMESKGYKWSRSDRMWIDNGDMAADWADLENDYRKENAK